MIEHMIEFSFSSIPEKFQQKLKIAIDNFLHDFGSNSTEKMQKGDFIKLDFMDGNNLATLKFEIKEKTWISDSKDGLRLNFKLEPCFHALKRISS